MWVWWKGQWPPVEYHRTSPNALLPAACYGCCLCKTEHVIYRSDPLPLTVLFRKPDFQAVAFLTSQTGWGTNPENIPNCLQSNTPLITNKHLHSTGLSSTTPDLRAVCLALFTVRVDFELLAKQQGKQCLLSGIKRWIDLSNIKKLEECLSFCLWLDDARRVICVFQLWIHAVKGVFFPLSFPA